MTERVQNWVTCYLFITLLVSSFVLFEPAPYDLLMILFVVFGYLFSFIKIRKASTFPLIIIFIFLISNLLSIFFAEEIKVSILFVSITLYLALTWIGLVGIIDYLKPNNLQLIVKAYLISACLSAILGILAYLELIPFDDLLLMYGRAKGLFKDPNVFGPFLVFPALFAISMTERRGITRIKKSIYFGAFLILTTGVIVSFSRAAWGNYAISLFIFLFVLKREFIRKRIKTFMFLILVGVPIFLYLLQTPVIEDFLISRLSYQNYDNDRFSTQKAAFLSGLTNPFGVGAGQSDNVFQYSPHSLYARVFTENGVVGLLSIVLLIVLSISKSFKGYWYTRDEHSVLYLVISASLIGLAFNSFFVDTLHWRNLWLLLALAWAPKLDFQAKVKERDGRLEDLP